MAGRFKKAWMAFVLRLGKIQTAILLFLVYYLVIGPMALLVRLIGRQDLIELRDSHPQSYAHDKTQVPTDPERCERQF